jgi:D-amino peptidase
MKHLLRCASRSAVFVTVALLAVAALSAQQPAPSGLKVLISADMEGVGGVSTWSIQAGSKGREYEKFRVLMTREVNAAVAGAYDAGATEVVVGDSHGDAQNIDVELLDPRVRLIRAWPRPLGMMQGVDASFGAVVFVGYHAAEGRAAATLSHSFSGTVEVELDGVPVPEAGFNAAIAGDFGVPVVFLSGDQTICEDARKLLGPIETAVVKEATGFYSATMIHPDEAQKRIREGVRRGVERRKEIKPYRIAHPVTLKIRYNSTVEAEVVAMLPGVERPAGNVVLFRGKDMVEVSKFFEAISNIRVQ